MTTNDDYLKEAKDLARKAGCFVVEKSHGVNKVFLLYREAPWQERNIFLGKRKTEKSMLALVKKICL